MDNEDEMNLMNCEDESEDGWEYEGNMMETWNGK
jgi:hypothetical protein